MTTSDLPSETTPAAKNLQRKRVRQKLGGEDILRRGLFVLLAVWLFVFLIWPLYRSLARSMYDKAGEEFVGIANYIKYFTTASTAISLRHSINIALLSMVITVTLAFVFAYAITRTTIRGRSFLHAIARLPMFVPSLVQALALIYIFGNNGIFTGSSLPGFSCSTSAPSSSNTRLNSPASQNGLSLYRPI